MGLLVIPVHHHTYEHGCPEIAASYRQVLKRQGPPYRPLRNTLQPYCLYSGQVRPPLCLCLFISFSRARSLTPAAPPPPLPPPLSYLCFPLFLFLAKNANPKGLLSEVPLSCHQRNLNLLRVSAFCDMPSFSHCQPSSLSHCQSSCYRPLTIPCCLSSWYKYSKSIVNLHPMSSYMSSTSSHSQLSCYQPLPIVNLHVINL